MKFSSKIRRPMIRSISQVFCRSFLLGLILFLFFPCRSLADGEITIPGPVSLQSDLEISLELGDGGKYRSFVGIPASIHVTNQSVAEFRGQIYLITPYGESEKVREKYTQLQYLLTSDDLTADSLQDGRNCLYQTKWQITIPPMETINLETHITIPSDTSALHTIILDGDGKEVLKTSHPIQKMRSNETMLFLAAFPEDPMLNGLTEGMRVYYANQSQKVHVVKLSPDTSFDQLEQVEPEALFVSHACFESFTEEQKQQILSWEAAGGVVFFEDEITSDLVRERVQESSLLHRVAEQANQALSRYQGLSFISNMDPAPTRSFSVVLTVLLIFTLLAGPGLWFLLRRFGKLKLHWNLLAMISLLPIAVFADLSLIYTDRAPEIRYLDRQNQKKNGFVEEEILFSLRTPYQDEVTLYVNPDLQLHPLIYGVDSWKEYEQGKTGAYSEAEQVCLSYQKEEIEISVDHQAAYSEQFYELRVRNLNQTGIPDQETSSDRGPLQVRVQLNGTTMTVYLENQTGYQFSDSLLLTPAGYYQIGQVDSLTYTSLTNLSLHSYNDLTDTGISVSLLNCMRDWKLTHLMNSSEDFLFLGEIDNYVPDYWMHSGYERNGVSFYTAPAALEANKYGWIDSNWAGSGFANPMLSDSFRKNQEVDALMLHDQQTEIIYHLEDLFDETIKLKALTFATPINQDQPFQGTIECFNNRTGQYDSFQYDGEMKWIDAENYIENQMLKVRFVMETERESSFDYAPVLIIRERREM